ncbi:MAG: DNA-binding protein, partial [Candidatus Geothermarchaeales archaeon]
SEPRKVMSRFGQINRLAIATIGDEDEKINLALWNQQIDSIVVNDVIQVKNGYITEFYGVKQLNVGKRGELKVIK